MVSRIFAISLSLLLVATVTAKAELSDTQEAAVDNCIDKASDWTDKAGEAELSHRWESAIKLHLRAAQERKKCLLNPGAFSYGQGVEDNAEDYENAAIASGRLDYLGRVTCAYIDEAKATITNAMPKITRDLDRQLLKDRMDVLRRYHC
jgi:hypothetical protein